jgi:2-aminoadipate transaminase
MGGGVDFIQLLSSAARSLPPSRPVAPTAGRISFAYGLCAPESFRPAELAECCRRVLERSSGRVLQYGPIQGSRGLLERLSSFLQERSLPVGPENLILTTGSMQGLELVGQLLLDPGDVALVEGPTFMGALEIFRKLRCRLVALPMDEEGIVPDQLEDTIKSLMTQGQAPKLLYTIPTFQNPSGITASLDRRRMILEIVDAYGIPLVEDDAYREIWFHAAPPPPYLLLAPSSTIYLGTFSKLLAPGLRLGWIAAPTYVVANLLALKRDAGSSPFIAEIVATFMAEYDFEAHLAQLRNIYHERAQAIHQSALQFLAKTARWREPSGGFFLWMETPGVTDAQLLEAMAGQGVEAIPGSQCFPDSRPTSCLRVAYSSIPRDQIADGIMRIGRALETILQ